MGKTTESKLAEAHVRLFLADIATLKRIAKKNGSTWHIELRQLVRRALQGERREFLVIKENE